MNHDAFINSGFQGIAIGIMFAIVYLVFLIARAVFRGIKKAIPRTLEDAARSAGAASAIVEQRLSAAKNAYHDGRKSGSEQSTKVESRLPPLSRNTRSPIEIIEVQSKPKRLSFFTVASAILLTLLFLTFIFQFFYL